MVKKKAKNNHAKDYALGGGAVSTTAKVTAVPQCDVVELTVTRQPGHGELKRLWWPDVASNRGVSGKSVTEQAQ